MLETGPLYTPLEEALPAVYRRDAYSFEQIRTYFRPLNVVCRQFVLALDELPAWLSPAATQVTPPGTWGGTEAERIERQSEVLDEVAAWFDFSFEPESVWRLTEDPSECRALLEAKSRALRALPRLMRTRGTARGFLELFCTAFRLDPRSPDECPVLLEYCAHRPDAVEPSKGAPDPGCQPAGDDDEEAEPRILCDDRVDFLTDDGIAWRATLLLPPVSTFRTHDGSRDAREWIERNAPAHLWIDLHRVSASFWPELIETVLPSGASRTEVLALVRTRVTADEALHTGGDDQLDAGRLPSEGGQGS
ncbi:hypothetical protein [Engelhardtia mirabilis]|uniref:Uncharacterized protein n=1 Tax=Engelhardtia mirabilis TaxID=2528011 RepID=A0A518BPM8_9BACT|nr:hypothetical protein Pla133_40450 [Planctomycetes bacterium Pla133]QDV03257.1 hypothetical protein Pla86_40440 [Planctomycetes bacterium Pla86]